MSGPAYSSTAGDLSATSWAVVKGRFVRVAAVTELGLLWLLLGGGSGGVYIPVGLVVALGLPLRAPVACIVVRDEIRASKRRFRAASTELKFSADEEGGVVGCGGGCSILDAGVGATTPL